MAPPSKQVARAGGVAVGLIVLGVILWQQRTRDPVTSGAPSTPATSVTAPSAGPGPAAIKAPVAPELPAAGAAVAGDDPHPKLPEPNSKPVAIQFVDEIRDATWAKDTESAIAKRMDAAPAKLTTECRTSHCQIVIDGAQADVDKTIAIMEREFGLRGISKEILLGKPIAKSDGSLSLRMFVTFDR